MIRTYGLLIQVPTSWPIETSANGNRQRMVIVATTSQAKAVAAINDALGVAGYVKLGTFRTYGYPDMGGIAKEVAEARPGVVFYSGQDRSRSYEPTPGQEE